MNNKIIIPEGKYKLFNTDGKTFFEFRSNPKSICEGFTVSYLDDGTVCMSGDYGTLCWKRYEHGERYDYAFPSKETNISYFAEKVCQWGVKQQIEEFDKETFLESIKDNYGEEDNYEEFLDDIKYIEENNEWEFRKKASDYFTDSWECKGNKYTDSFVFMFKLLQSVSEQVWDATRKTQ